MRINLLTPFAEKDAAKALGARWDSKTRNWYIVDVADLTPFLRWIPNREAAMDNVTDGTIRAAKGASKAQINQFKGPTTGSSMEVLHCGCDIQPWEDCIHTLKS